MGTGKKVWGWRERVVLGGVALGMIAFLVFGIVPALVYGGYAALTLLFEIQGSAVEPSIVAKVFVVVGMLLGVIALASLFAVAGAIVGLVSVGIGHVGSRVAQSVKGRRLAPEHVTRS